MPWIGANFSRTTGPSPQYTGPNAWQQEEANGYDILSVRADFHDQDLATGIDACLNKNGNNTMTANLSMGGNKIVGVDDGTADTDAVSKQQLDSAISNISQVPIDGTTGQVLISDGGVDYSWSSSFLVTGNSVWGGNVVDGSGIQFGGAAGISAINATDPTGVDSKILIITALAGVWSIAGNINIGASGGCIVNGTTGDFQTDGTMKAPNLTTGSVSPNAHFDPSTGEFIRITSSIRYKENIEDYTPGLAAVEALRPVSWTDKGKEDSPRVPGYIAEEIDDAGLYELVQYKDGRPESLNYDRFTTLLVNAVKELSEKNKELIEKNSQIEDRLSLLVG